MTELAHKGLYHRQFAINCVTFCRDHDLSGMPGDSLQVEAWLQRRFGKRQSEHRDQNYHLSWARHV
jgi:hypothetical protein